MGRLRGAAIVLVMAAAVTAVGARGDVVGGANVRVSFHGWLTPKELPRRVAAPVALHVKGSLRTTDRRNPPGLERVRIEINRHASISTAGLPRCRYGSIDASTSRRALAVCRRALVGTGTFKAHITIPEQAPFPARGRLLAFNAVLGGRHVILAHVFGRKPVPTGEVLVLSFERPQGGTFGAVLSLQLPEVAGDWGHVTGFRLDLHRRYRAGGRIRSMMRASCPAPRGFRLGVFPAARGTYYLSDGRVIRRLVTGTCRVRPPR